MSQAHSVGGITVRQTDGQQNAPPGRSRAGSLRHARPSWVNRVILTVGWPLPVYPDQRTFSKPVGMSQRCHFRTHAVHQRRELFDLIGADEQRGRNGQSERLGGR
jgi:hypothetical protein